ncbi:MAG TPA: 2-isopropylmalate synthase [Dehalococcoidia bacterium]|nr:2-isopropylmalate synthase [Dehalococcoidia bacterium]
MVRAGVRVNSERVYYNFEGRLPPVTLEQEAVAPPPDDGQPKLITDTTLRDGAQDSRIALFPHEARVRYFDLLHRLDNGAGRIYAVEVFIYQKRDLWTLEKLLDRGYEWPKVTTWTRATPKDIKQLVEVAQDRVKETGMLASASDHHIFDKLGFASKEDAIEKYLQPIRTAVEHGITPRIHLEDCTRADIYGWVIPFMQRVLDESRGIAKFRICDTIGWGVPDPYAALPWGIPRLFATLKAETGAELEFHGHNDFGLATANSIASWRYGGTKVNAAFGGLGERTGNTSLEQMVAALIRLYGDPGFDLTALEEMKRLIDTEVTPLPDRAPIIGDVFTTSAGIHQAGLSRQEEAPGGLIYLPFAASLFGRTEVELSRLGALSGAEGIVSVLNRELERIGSAQRVSTTNRVVKRIYDRIQEAYDGVYDPATDTWSGYRRSFFTPDEVLAMARECGLDADRTK